jgi:molybdopterin-binding protein
LPNWCPTGADRRQRHSTAAKLSARNRMTGIVASVEVDGVMALVKATSVIVQRGD